MNESSPLVHDRADVGVQQSSKTAMRRTLGLLLLALVVVLWVTSSFLQSSFMADGEFAKPYFVTYVNTSVFILTLIPLCAKQLRHRVGHRAWLYQRLQPSASDTSLMPRNDGDDDEHDYNEATRRAAPQSTVDQDDAPLTVRQTMRLAAKFCGMWFLANLLNAASFNHTSVASSTILTSTSSVFTLLFGVAARTERFSPRKLLGVLASLGGVALVSLLDTRGGNADDDSTGDHRGRFPYKTPGQIALGDGMALMSACCYGLYATLLVRAVGDERRIDMPLFFGLIGVCGAAALWPGLPLLHAAGLELFSWPPNGRVVGVLLANAAVSLVSDVCWAYAVLLTSPLVVTVGLALTIPLSLVGQIVINAQYVGAWYWFGAAIIVASFVFVNYEERRTSVDHPLAVDAAGRVDGVRGGPDESRGEHS